MSRSLWYLRIASIEWNRTGEWVNDPRWEGEFADSWIQLFWYI